MVLVNGTHSAAVSGSSCGCQSGRLGDSWGRLMTKRYAGELHSDGPPHLLSCSSTHIKIPDTLSELSSVGAGCAGTVLRAWNPHPSNPLGSSGAPASNKAVDMFCLWQAPS